MRTGTIIPYPPWLVNQNFNYHKIQFFLKQKVDTENPFAGQNTQQEMQSIKIGKYFQMMKNKFPI